MRNGSAAPPWPHGSAPGIAARASVHRLDRGARDASAQSVSRRREGLSLPLPRLRREFPLARARTSCAACGGLLDVVPDLRAFGRTGAAWRDLFDRRRAAPRSSEATRPYEMSGVWRFREHVFPDLPESGIVSKPEGATRLYAGGALGEELGLSRLFVKHEGENPTLSFKDRGMTAGVSWARAAAFRPSRARRRAIRRRRSRRTPPRCPACAPSSSCRTRRSRTSSSARRSRTGRRRSGSTRTSTAACGSSRELTAARPRLSPELEEPRAHRGAEDDRMGGVQDLGWRVPDWFVVPVGNAGNISAIGKGLREWLDLGIIEKKPRLAGIQAAAADPFYQSYGKGSQSASRASRARRRRRRSASARPCRTRRPSARSASSTASSRA